MRHKNGYRKLNRTHEHLFAFSVGFPVCDGSVCLNLKDNEFDYRSLCRQDVWVTAMASLCNQVAAANDSLLQAAASISIRSKIGYFLFKKFTHLFNDIFLHLANPLP